MFFLWEMSNMNSREAYLKISFAFILTRAVLERGLSKILFELFFIKAEYPA